MTRSLSWFPSLLGLVLLAIVVVSLPLILRNAPAPAQPAQVVSPPATPAETETPTPLAPTPEPTEDVSTATSPPAPTLLPTPVVTPIPLAPPPIIPLPDGETQPYTLLFRQGATVQAINHDGTDQRTLLDVQARTGLFLPLDIDDWGSPSPDGQRLALVFSDLATVESLQRGQFRQFSIYLFDRATDELRLLVDGSAQPVWSPDGAKIAYAGAGGLWIADLATGETRRIYQLKQDAENFVTDISWAPDSKRIAFLDLVFRQFSTLMAINVDDPDSVKALTTRDTHWQPFLPRWSPDGSRILFISWSGVSSLADRTFTNLWVINPDGAEQTQLTFDMDTLGAGRPAWSPDGQWIAFTGITAYETAEPNWDLWLVNPQQRELKRVTANNERNVNVGFVRWSPDGKQIVYGIDRQAIWAVSLFTGEHRQLPITSVNVLIVPWRL